MLLDDMTRIRNHIQAIRQSKVSPPPGGAAAAPVTPAPSTPAVASTPAPSIQRPDSAMLVSIGSSWYLCRDQHYFFQPTGIGEKAVALIFLTVPMMNFNSQNGVILRCVTKQ